jgi:AcrR family transcriptional regulator
MQYPPSVAKRASKPARRGDVREEALSVATRLFASRGYAATPLQAICDEVGITKASLLYHYPSKEQLHAAVLESLLGHWKQVLPRLLEAATRGHEMYDVTVREVVSFFTEDPNRARLLMRESMDRELEMRDLVRVHMGPWAAIASAYIRKGKEQGRVRDDVDPEAYLVNFAAALIGCIAAGEVSTALCPDPAGTRPVDALVRSARHGLFVE